MSESAEFKVTMSKPNEEQILALNGLASAFGWEVEGFVPNHVESDGTFDETPQTDRQLRFGQHDGLARLVVKDDVDTTIESDTDEQVALMRYKQEVVDVAQEIVRPFSSIFDSKLPTADNNIKNRFGKNKDNVGLERSVSWRYKTDLGGNPPADLTYTFKLTYEQGAKVNHIKKVVMDIGSEKEISTPIDQYRWFYPNLELSFDESGEVYAISFKRSSWETKKMNRVMAGTTLKTVMDRLGFGLTGRNDLESLYINIPDCIIRHHQAITLDDSIYKQKLTSEYKVGQAMNGVINRSFSSEKGLELVMNARNKSPGSSITIGEYYQIIKDLLSMIPVSSV